MDPHRTYANVDARLLEDLRKAGHRRIALQVPAGLLPMAPSLALQIAEATGATIVTPTRACFGGCDPPSPEETLGAEAIVTLGHAPILNMTEPVPEYYVEMRTETGDVERLAEIVVARGLPRKLGLVASVQHLDLLSPLIAALAKKGVTGLVGVGGKRLAYPGQALGCNYTTATTLENEVEGFLFLGTGRFHPIGLSLSVAVPIWSLDPLQASLEGPYDRQKMINQRLLLVESAMDAKRWGVLASTFPGQMRRALAQRLVDKAFEHGKEAFLLTFDRLDGRDLVGRKMDAYVITACPRIAIDDASLYDRPMLTAPEFLSAIGDRPLTPYLFDTYV